MENALPLLPSAGWSPGLSDKVELFDFNLPKGTPMTDDRLPLAELAAKSGDSDFLRAIAESVLQLIMEADVDGLIGAGRYERGDGRQTWRNGYRDRSLDSERDEHPTFPFAIAAARTAPSPIGAERDGRRSR